MMGSAEQPGLIPRLCCSLFARTLEEQREGEVFTVEVSYLEIYNEKVRDLLDPKGSRQALKVREHSVMGPYVDGLSRLAVACYKDVESLMSEGNKSRTVAATNMNEESSRSHGVFNLILTHTLTDRTTGTQGEKVSKLSLVDLAGSERAGKTGAAGERLKEGSNINRSLSTLGLVISALAEQGAGKNKNKFVPYRDSVLTWLLKDSLGGNSRTAMVATVSPAADNYEETLSTLRYADRAKSIVNHAVVNEDPNARIIRELREEVEKLRDQLTQAESLKAPELKDRLEESEKLIQEMTVTWEDKLTKTEAVALERQRQLESLGISLQSSGIRVVEDRCFLVNLNADPALNELLVYYLKEHTRVGSADSQDIQLCGMAIQAAHCVIDITAQSGVVLTPHRHARTCVNGAVLSAPLQLHHGDRILWGNNHFFRINLPRNLSQVGAEGEGEEEGVANMKAGLSSDRPEEASDGAGDMSFGYEFAQTEVLMNTMGQDDPIHAALQTLGRQYEEEKRSALERQRLLYEQELEHLRKHLPPERSGALLEPGPAASCTPLARMRRWSEDREAMMSRGLLRLREQIVRTQLLVQEAGFLSEELGKKTEYLVTLQIPAANLDANRKRDVVLSEPAVQVRRKGRGKLIWSLEKMENRLLDMKDLYQEWKDCQEDTSVTRSYFRRADPFFDEQENHSLVGVANVFLSCLFHDVRLQYAVPIINQKGEVSGRLHVEVCRGSEDPPDPPQTDSDAPERTLTCVVRILQATGLPRHLSNFVFCQYRFWGQEQLLYITPELELQGPPGAKDPHCTVVFDSTERLTVSVTEELVEFLADGAVAIEVYGHKLLHHRRNLALWDLEVIQAKTRSLRERWMEVTRRLQLWVQVMELSEAGVFSPVEVLPARDVATGGVYQLQQGQSRRVCVEVRGVPESGTMPLIAASIHSVAIGDVQVRKTRPPRGNQSQWDEEEEMDSYQEIDLERMREQWLATVTKRQEYLDQHLQKVVSKPDKCEEDVEREAQLLEGRLTLTEERNAVLVPAEGSGIPGAPAQRVPVPGMETHVPVLFLDLSADDFQDSLSPSLAGGQDALLSGEDEDAFFDLHIVRHHDDQATAEASWDSTVHDCAALSRAGPADQRVYLTLRAVVQLSHPARMQLVLRKRLCVAVNGRQGFAKSLLRRVSQRSSIPGSGVTFEVVSNIPGEIQGPEDREMLARLAASMDDSQSEASEAAIEKYLRSVLAVENILALDRLRQEVAVKEQLAVKGSPRRYLSSPIVNQGWESHQDLFSASPSSRRTLPSSASQTLHPNPTLLHPNTGKAVPKLLNFLVPDDREEMPANQQAVPTIMVQSASVDESLGQTPAVPAPHTLPPEDQPEAPSVSRPLPPPVVPETKDSAHSPLSQSSSGYASTSISTATLSDVYTLSWDLPPLLGNEAEHPEDLPTSSSPSKAFLQSLRPPDQSEPGSDEQEVSEATEPFGGDQVTSSGLLEPQVLTEPPEQGVNQSGPLDQEDNQSGSSEQEDNQSEPSDQEDNQSEPSDQEDNQSGPSDQEDNQSGSSDQEDNQSGSSDQEVNQSQPSKQGVNQSGSSEQGDNQSGSSDQEDNQSGSSEQGDDQSEAPVLENNQSEAPVIENNQSEAPVLENTQSEAPVLENTQSEAPVLENTQSETPVLENTQSEAPVLENNQSEVPFLENTQSEAPVLENNQSEASSAERLMQAESASFSTSSSSPPPEDLDPVPALDQVDPVPALDQVDPEPALDQVDPDPALDQVDPVPALDQVDPEPALDQVDPVPALDQVDPEPALDQVDPEPAPPLVDLGEGLQEPQDPTMTRTPSEPDEQEPTEPVESYSGPIPVLTFTPALDQDQDPVDPEEPAPPSQTTVPGPQTQASGPSPNTQTPGPGPGPQTPAPGPPQTPAPGPKTQTQTPSPGPKTQIPSPGPKTPGPGPAPGLLVAQTGAPVPGPVGATSPFKIQKVQKLKSSDLKSFQPVLKEEELSPGAGLTLPEPMERLEIISDSEDAGGTRSATPVPDWLKEGEYVAVGTNKTGTVRYVGPTDFAEGVWIGVELEVPAGKNDGSVAGRRYFLCNHGYGMLVRPDRVTRVKRRRQQRRGANLSGSSPNLAALTALAKGEGGGASRSKGENRKSWNN
ncbi:kinesin-like protein KIF13B isoform X2 [Gadus chalcogrammus]|uniref:kinesin-like protein KIF13B isoform X2 n=1 Tax=Gadus chalcogrammus TaxID=1042646 RepID=UPI0024C4B455|nr:kinesin-like protein KIF13B isoform X2 [Gadus chalcogrammus]